MKDKKRLKKLYQELNKLKEELDETCEPGCSNCRWLLKEKIESVQERINRINIKYECDDSDWTKEPRSKKKSWSREKIEF